MHNLEVKGVKEVSNLKNTKVILVWGFWQGVNDI